MVAAHKKNLGPLESNIYIYYLLFSVSFFYNT